MVGRIVEHDVACRRAGRGQRHYSVRIPSVDSPFLASEGGPRFHALYLPAVLMALELPLPKTILAHGHWTMEKLKMSKSRGNVADPIAAMREWGIDPIRAYLMRVGGNAAADAGSSLPSCSCKSLLNKHRLLTCRDQAILQEGARWANWQPSVAN